MCGSASKFVSHEMDLVAVDLVEKDRTVVARRVAKECLVVYQCHRQIGRVPFQAEIPSLFSSEASLLRPMHRQNREI